MTERQVTVVCGPPCSGKTTYVRERAQPGDVVLDYDDIARQLGSRRTHGHDYRYHKPTQAIIDRYCQEIAEGKHARAWVIRSLPKVEEREHIATRLNAKVVVLDAPDDVLKERAAKRWNSRQTVAAIDLWRSSAERPVPSR